VPQKIRGIVLDVTAKIFAIWKIKGIICSTDTVPEDRPQRAFLFRKSLYKWFRGILELGRGKIDKMPVCFQRIVPSFLKELEFRYKKPKGGLFDVIVNYL